MEFDIIIQFNLQMFGWQFSMEQIFTKIWIYIIII